jgi:integrase/recombinase XerD
MSEAKQHVAEISLYDGQGRRKYLTANERKRFRMEAEKLPPSERSFCLLHYLTGLRISEALEATVARIDLGEGVVIIRSLKRRKDNVFRAVPLPMSYLKALKLMSADAPSESRLWPFSRKTGYRIIKGVMRKAEISGLHASPKGLRHGFGIACVQQNIPLPTISKWMGHSSIKTTAIYLNAVGAEEREFARRIW